MIFKELEEKLYKIQNRVMLSLQRQNQQANSCKGKRLPYQTHVHSTFFKNIELDV
jgi:excinuclease ABC subunit A